MTTETEIQERLLSIAGWTPDVNEALDDFEHTKDAVSELYDKNQALEILNRRLNLCLTLAQAAMTALENDAGMFITPKTRAKMNQFFEQLEKAQNAIIQSREIQEKS